MSYVLRVLLELEDSYPETAKLEKNNVALNVVHPKNFDTGFITPRGKMLRTVHWSHGYTAERNNTSLDKLMDEGTMRINAGSITAGQLNVQTNVHPTDRQIGALVKLAKHRDLSSLYLSHGTDLNRHTSTDEPLTASTIRKHAKKVF